MALSVSKHAAQIVLSPSSESDSKSLGDKGQLQILPFKLPSKRRPKLNQRRAARACLGCRARKVRCDVTRRQPCGNCIWTGQECTTKAHLKDRMPKPDTTKPCTELSKPLEPSSSASTPFCETIDYESHQDSDTSDSNSPAVADISVIGDSPLPPPSVCTSFGTDGLNEGRIHSPSRDEDAYLNQLPGFIRCFGKVLDGDDWEFLRSKKALTLPSPPLQAALIRAYLEHVQPLLPVLDVRHFLRSFDARSGQLSLLLFQSVLFAGSAFIGMSHLIDAGFQTRTEARLAFFERARILYDFGCEKDRLTILQSLLLMTLWHELPGQHRNVPHWVDAAISQAFAIDLHLEPSLIEPMMPLKVQKFRRRLWWCCVIRDRLICLGKGRPPMIKDGDFNVYMLELSDFEFDSTFTEHSRLLDAACSYIWNEGKHEELARICIAQAKVCKCVRLSPLDKGTFESHQLELLSWYDSLSPWEQFRPLTTSRVCRDRDASAEFNRTMLHVTYHVACLRLHQARLNILVNDPTTSKLDLELLKIDMQFSFCRLEEIIRNIEELSPTEFLLTLEMMFAVSATEVDFMSITRQDSEGDYRCAQTVDSMEELGSVLSPSEASDKVWTPTDSEPSYLYAKDTMECPSTSLSNEEVLRVMFKGVFMEEFMPSMRMESQNHDDLAFPELANILEADCVLEGLGPLYEIFWQDSS